MSKLTTVYPSTFAIYVASAGRPLPTQLRSVVPPTGAAGSVRVDGSAHGERHREIRRLHHTFDDDGETALTSTYVQVIQGLPDFPPQTIATAIYRDVLRRRDGTWTFTERVTDGSLRGDLSRHLRRRRDRPAL
jgi:hypothetical protein